MRKQQIRLQIKKRRSVTLTNQLERLIISAWKPEYLAVHRYHYYDGRSSIFTNQRKRRRFKSSSTSPKLWFSHPFIKSLFLHTIFRLSLSFSFSFSFSFSYLIPHRALSSLGDLTQVSPPFLSFFSSQAFSMTNFTDRSYFCVCVFIDLKFS